MEIYVSNVEKYVDAKWDELGASLLLNHFPNANTKKDSTIPKPICASASTSQVRAWQNIDKV